MGSDKQPTISLNESVRKLVAELKEALWLLLLLLGRAIIVAVVVIVAGIAVVVVIIVIIVILERKIVDIIVVNIIISFVANKLINIGSLSFQRVVALLLLLISKARVIGKIERRKLINFFKFDVELVFIIKVEEIIFALVVEFGSQVEVREFLTFNLMCSMVVGTLG